MRITTKWGGPVIERKPNESDRQYQRRCSQERINDPAVKILKTIDIAFLCHKSVPWVHKARRLGWVPDAAKPFRLSGSQRGLFWDKDAVFAWIEEMRSQGRVG